MKEPHLDYHVGLMRGYLLANNAPTQILHALDILLTNYRSQAGESIGHAQGDVQKIQAISTPEQKIEKPILIPQIDKSIEGAEDTVKDAISKNNPWKNEDDRIAAEMYKTGASISDIAFRLNRTVGATYQRFKMRGIKRNSS